ncbi:hypothetical protein KAH27_03690 [bacterium]|nr:hypothetical protein [bacterium]
MLKKNKFILRFVILMCCAGCLLINSSADGSKIAAGAALPFAAIGDTAIVPFQMMGYMSKALIAQGDGAGAYTQYSSFTAQYDEASVVQLVFYIPGYAMGPFLPFANFKYYSMTQSCLDSFTVNDQAYRRQRTMY